MDNIFYHPSPEEKTILSLEESYHAVRVMRLHNGDKILLTDGKGKLYKAEITNANPAKCKIEIRENLINKEAKDKSLLHIAIAPPKNSDRFEWFLEKATEIGIHEITPLICEHSVRRNLNMERAEKIVISAMKQSLGLFLPKIHSMRKFSDFINEPSSRQVQKFIALSTGKALIASYAKGNNVIVLIGPEGDFTQEEIEFAREKEYEEISLGKNRLRTETAAVAAACGINLLNCE